MKRGSGNAEEFVFSKTNGELHSSGELWPARNAPDGKGGKVEHIDDAVRR